MSENLKRRLSELLARTKDSVMRGKLGSCFTVAVDYLTLRSMAKDPLSGEGGSKKHVEASVQALNDLARNWADDLEILRLSNLMTPVTILGETRSWGYWLGWKDKVYTQHRHVLQSYLDRVRSNRDQFYRQKKQTDSETLEATFNETDVLGMIKVLDAKFNEIKTQMDIINVESREVDLKAIQTW